MTTTPSPANPYLHPLTIGHLEISNNLALAPMAGTTDATYRPICHGLGAGLVVTELVSARGITYDPDLKRSWRYLEITPEAEKPVAIQLFGADPDDFYRAILKIHENPILSQCDLIDINMGCPVPKVVRGGEGSALMKTPDIAARVIEASVRALATIAGAGADVSSAGSAAVKPLTVKFRKGWDAESVNAVEFAQICQNAGTAAITIHARTRDQFYSGKADWEIIAAVKAAVQIPVYGNGDLNNLGDARKMIDQTGVDGLMIGRAALGNPWIFDQLQTELGGGIWSPPSAAEKAAMMRRHVYGLSQHLGEFTGVTEMRKQLAAYLRGTRDAAHWKNLAMQAKTLADVETVLNDWLDFQQNPV
ncbi:MAG: tRNA dihydrouridine synthase DusB [Eubacteriales bacterium]|nr:tRNA dihydrouridine synthase DusB [Eubacteriales bacterium]